MRLTPLYDLEKVKECIRKRESRPQSITFPKSDKSFDAVVRVFGEKNKELSKDDAVNYILGKMLILKVSDFCEHGKFFKIDADVYGKAFDGEVWYIKIVYDEESDSLKEISFHPSEHDMITQNGTNIGKGKCKIWKI